MKVTMRNMLVIMGLGLLLRTAIFAQEATEMSANKPEPTKVNLENWYEFKPERDDFAPTATDLSGLIEAPAGKHGFLGVKGDKFVFENGQTARFWGAQVGLWSKEDTDYGVKALRKRGINIVRLHGMTFLNKRDAETSFEYDESAFDKLDYMLHRFGQEGIYFILDVDYTFPVRPGDKVPGLERGGSRFLMFFNEQIAEIKRRRMTDVFTRVNKYNNKRYCDDPTLALVEICNEDSIFWHLVDQIPEPFQSQLQGRFKEWLAKKYENTAALRKAWMVGEKDALQDGEGLGADEKLAILAMWMFSENRLKEAPEIEKRGLDQMRFFTELENAYWQSAHAHLRKIGIKVPISGTNWKGGGFTTRAHMLTQSRLEYIDRHGYWDHPQGEGNARWRISTAKFFNLPMVKTVSASNDPIEENNVGNLVLSKAWEQILGMPMSISEWNTCTGNEYSLEGTGVMAAYGLLQGWDAPLQFGHFDVFWQNVMGPNSFNMLSTPPQLLQYPAVALMWNRQDVREADVVSEILYTPEDLFEFKEDRRSHPMMAACVGKVGYRFVESPREPIRLDIAKFYDEKNQTAKSMTGELEWNAKDGIVTIDTPRTFGVIGFLSVRGHAGGDVSLKSSTRFGAVYVSSIDGDKPVSEARRLLVTAVGPSRNTGMKYKVIDEVDKRQNAQLWMLENAGTAPIIIESIIGELSVRNANAQGMKAWALDVNGKRVQQVPLTVADGRLRLPLERAHATMYYEISAE